jgi:glucosamine-6-phosphate deaminase
MSIAQILRSERLVVTVPDRRKAQAVRDAVEGPIGPGHPASALRRHDRCMLYLEPLSAALLSPSARP